MSEFVTFPKPSGASYVIPDVGDSSWGQNVTDFLVAIPNGVVPTSGTFTLTGDLNWGGSFGLISQYYKSGSANISTAGVIRLAHGDSIGFRNNALGGNLLLTVNSSDQLLWNGVVLQTLLTLGNLTDAGTDGITVTGGTGAVVGSGTSIAQHVADASHNGYLSSTDWSTFNNKLSAAVTSLTGTINQVTASASTGAVTLSLPPNVILGQSLTLGGDGVSGITLYGNPSNSNLVSLGTTGATAANYNLLLPTSVGSTGQVLTAGVTSATNQLTWSTPTTGTVTSVAATVPAFLSVSGSPVTTSGTLAISLSGTALPVLNGGTGVTTSTGSGANALATGPTLVTPILGAATATSINFGGTTLANYLEGTWTPTDGSGASLSLTVSSAKYTRIGNTVHIECFLSYPVTASGSAVQINGLPFTVNGYATARIYSNTGVGYYLRFNDSSTNFTIYTSAANVAATNANLTSSQVMFSGIYFV